jgi:hypothetical protein
MIATDINTAEWANLSHFFDVIRAEKHTEKEINGRKMDKLLYET